MACSFRETSLSIHRAEGPLTVVVEAGMHPTALYYSLLLTYHADYEEYKNELMMFCSRFVASTHTHTPSPPSFSLSPSSPYSFSLSLPFLHLSSRFLCCQMLGAGRFKSSVVMIQSTTGMKQFAWDFIELTATTIQTYESTQCPYSNHHYHHHPSDLAN